MQETRLSALSPARRKLVLLMRAIGHGEIRNLVVRDGDPRLDATTEVVREVLLGSRNDAAPPATSTDFVVRTQVVELFQQLDLLGSCTVEALEVRGGLPFRLRLRGRAEPESRRTSAGGGR